MFALELHLNGVCPLCLLQLHDAASACFFALTDEKSQYKLKELLDYLKTDRYDEKESERKSSADVAFSVVSASRFCRSKPASVPAIDILQGRHACSVAVFMFVFVCRLCWRGPPSGDTAPRANRRRSPGCGARQRQLRFRAPGLADLAQRQRPQACGHQAQPVNKRRARTEGAVRVCFAAAACQHGEVHGNRALRNAPGLRDGAGGGRQPGSASQGQSAR